MNLPYKDPERAKQNKKDYYRLNRTEILRKKRDYYKTHKKQIRKKQLKYKQTHQEEIKNINQNWRKNNPEHHKEYCRKNPELIKKCIAKHRKLGFIPFNEAFIGSEGHHIDFECVIYIPRELHNSIKHCVWTGKGMDEINDKALEWLITKKALFDMCI